MSTAYHPQTDGQSEYTIQTLKDMLKAYVEVGEGLLIGHKIMQEITEKISYIKDRLKTARDRQKNYANKRRKPFRNQFDAKLHFVEEPIEILEREIKKLKRSRIPIVKVRRNSKRGPEFTWEREDQMKLKYPHLLSSSAS
ncbi:reverse transcriptase domain-containing protein [Tanacetum coccineum]